MAKGIEYPQRADRSFIGAYIAPEQKARFVAVAGDCGLTVTELLTALIDRIEPLAEVMGLTLVSGEVTE